MRFILTQDIQQNKIIRTGVFWLIITSLVFIFFGVSYDALQYGLTPEKILKTINGNPSEFVEPLPLDVLMLDTHLRLFLLLVLTLVLFSILFRAPLSINQKIYWTNFTYVMILLDALSIYGIKYISPAFSYIKVLALFSMSFSIGSLCLYLLYFIFKKPSAHV